MFLFTSLMFLFTERCIKAGRDFFFFLAAGSGVAPQSDTANSGTANSSAFPSS